MSSRGERLSETKINKTGDHYPSSELDDRNDNTDHSGAALLTAVKDNRSIVAKLMPMSPLAASATVTNLLLATGPFR